MSVFAGCSTEKEKEIPMPVLDPEIQLLEDSYESKKEITDNLTCVIDYVSEGEQTLSTTNILHLFEHPKIQVDNLDVVTLGQTTMQELVDIVDEANTNYITEKTDALIAERQKLIDEEYEAAKAKAEAAGKTYDTPKKTVRTDDINFEAPYTYYLLMDGEETLYYYTPTYLVNPGIYGTINFLIYKYNIPYVYFTFKATNIYNLGITQESDWIVNAANIANVSDHINAETGLPLSYVDVDGLNKAAKKNVRMSGNILFSGEGFTWDSLETLCLALGLPEGARSAGYQQSSNKQFGYYTVTYRVNPFEFDENLLAYTGVAVPIVTYVATFDLIEQTCLAWSVEMYSDYEIYNGKYHEVGDSFEVNVHDYTVDTGDYDGMRETIHEWIDDNAMSWKTEYHAIDTATNESLGILETGTLNADSEIVIKGKPYICLDSKIKDGSLVGTYVPQDDYYNNNYANQKVLKICCCLVNQDNAIVAIYNGQKNEIELMNGQSYYVANVEETENGYKNVQVIDRNGVDQLLLVYVKTYQFNSYEAETLKEIAQFDGVIAIEEYLMDLFENEENETNKDANKKG